MPTTRSKRKRAEPGPFSTPTKFSDSKTPLDEQHVFRAMFNPEKSWPSSNMDNPEDREALLKRVFAIIKLCIEDVQEKVKEWTERWMLPSLDELSDDQKRRLLCELEGVCLQENWDVLQSELSMSSREHFGQTVAQAMIYKVIFTTFYDNPFWFCDGRTGDENNDVDPLFTGAMAHLYNRFLVDDPELAILWRMQLFRLIANKPGSKHLSAAPIHGSSTTKVALLHTES